MSIFDKTCIWCGQQFELEAHDNDAESFAQEMRDHKYYCDKRPKDEKLRKAILRAIKGKDLEESKTIINEIIGTKLEKEIILEEVFE